MAGKAGERFFLDIISFVSRFLFLISHRLTRYQLFSLFPIRVFLELLGLNDANDWRGFNGPWG